MKRLVLFVMLVLSLAANAQTSEKATKSISLEFLGVHHGWGLNYDSRIKGNEGLGYRVGLSYAYAFPGQDISYKGVAIPLEVNGLFGSKVAKFELGLGTSLGYYRKDDHSLGTSVYSNKFRILPFTNLGLRLQPKQGVTLRLGIAPQLELIYPYISLGYAF